MKVISGRAILSSSLGLVGGELGLSLAVVFGTLSCLFLLSVLSLRAQEVDLGFVPVRL